MINSLLSEIHSAKSLPPLLTEYLLIQMAVDDYDSSIYLCQFHDLHHNTLTDHCHKNNKYLARSHAGSSLNKKVCTKESSITLVKLQNKFWTPYLRLANTLCPPGGAAKKDKCSSDAYLHSKYKILYFFYYVHMHLYIYDVRRVFIDIGENGIEHFHMPLCAG